MKVKAKISFCGALTMAKGETLPIDDNKVVDDLIEAGYVEVVEEKEPKSEPEKEPEQESEEKQVQNEDKRGKPKSD